MSIRMMLFGDHDPRQRHYAHPGENGAEGAATDQQTSSTPAVAVTTAVVSVTAW